MRPKVYEGNENYIFVSYAHSDRDQVFEVLHALEEQGYRFWYDEGIAPGSEWAEDIARHLSRSYLVMAFITGRSVNSSNCRREINYALSKEKPFLSVVLEKTEMTEGLEMQLSAQQSVIKYNYPDHDTFIRKILACPDIAPCRKEPEPEPEPGPEPAETAEVPAEVAVPEVPAPSSSPSEPDSTQNAKPAPRKPAPHKSGKKDASAAKTTDKQPISKKKYLLLAAAAIILVVAIGIIISMQDYTSSWGEKYKRSKWSINIEDQTIQQDDIKAFAGFNKLESVSFTNCDLSNCDLSVLTEAKPELYTFSLYNCTGIDDYSFLSGLKAKELSITGSASFKDLSTLDLSETSTLDIRGTAVSDLSALKDSDQISHLYISDSAVENIDAIMSCSNLSTLNISDCDISKIGSECKSLRLRELYARNTKLSSLKAFSACTVLESIDVSGMKNLASLDWLNKQNSETLKELNISNTSIPASDLSQLSEYNSIEDLGLNNIQTENLDFCKGMTAIKNIYAEKCGIKDISGLKGKKELSTALLGSNEIEDVSPLSEMNASYSSYLDLAFNNISDFSKLKADNYSIILLCGNKDGYGSTIPEGINVSSLLIDWFDGIYDTWYAKNNGSGLIDIYLLGTPSDQIVKVEDIFGSRLVLTTEDEFYNKTLPELSSSVGGGD